MKKIRKYKNIIERFLSGESGQRFFNFAYSIGAAVVIWGALFKILHLPGGNTLLCIGMGTEVLMFILTAFDRPSRDYHWEEVFPVLSSHNPDERPDFAEGSAVVINGAAPTAAEAGKEAAAAAKAFTAPILTGDASVDVAAVTDNYIERLNSIATQMAQLETSTAALNAASDTLLGAYRAITENSDSVGASSTGYVEQMQALNRNIQGLNTIYEIQLRSVSSQLDAIDRVNQGIKDIRDMYERSAGQSTRYAEEAEKLTRQMEQLNHLYERMIKAMTVNMYNPGMAGAAVPPVES